MRVSPNHTHAAAELDLPTPNGAPKENPLVLKVATETQRLMAPYFLPFQVKLARETHPYEFFPRRWFESSELMGVMRGFSNHQAREMGLKKPTDEQRAFFHVLARVFQWPAPSIVGYFNELELENLKSFSKGRDLAKKVIGERGSRKKIHELSLIRLIDDEHYRIADELKKTLTNETLKHTFQARDFQIAKGW